MYFTFFINNFTLLNSGHFTLWTRNKFKDLNGEYALRSQKGFYRISSHESLIESINIFRNV